MNKKINLKYYIFDWDDNILHMSTKIIMEKLIDNKWELVEVPTYDFTKIRKDTNYRIPQNNYDLAFQNFSDTGQKGENIFLEDMKHAINNKNFGVSYNAFKKCLIDGCLFVCLTARGHEPNSIRKGIEYFIETQLTLSEKEIMLSNLKMFCEIFNSNNNLISDYLDLCQYIGVSSEYFKKLVLDNGLYEGNNFNPTNTELSKKIASKYIIEQLHKYKLNDDFTVKIGFSDDDKGNIESILSLFKEMKLYYPTTDFVIYNTSKNEDGSINYNKISV